ncbi:hypothetical protein BT63DRAFT_461132 [Microthyrium microscopicum]|uniref:Uncharacterized protein n=1 Tax=Microthyrium microscopicum TaxID=703497 RepID=A0A6A6TTL7_9PEZI|nr:hypothetical protein BT63DRAFT_461132 [Microthyrium microscopicum]
MIPRYILCFGHSCVKTKSALPFDERASKHWYQIINSGIRQTHTKTYMDGQTISSRDFWKVDGRGDSDRYTKALHTKLLPVVMIFEYRVMTLNIAESIPPLVDSPATISRQVRGGSFCSIFKSVVQIIAERHLDSLTSPGNAHVPSRTLFPQTWRSTRQLHDISLVEKCPASDDLGYK